MARFEAGKSGNPAGRPVGARNRLGEAFIEAVFADFQAHGAAAIERVRIEKPDAYLKVIASLLPRELNLTTSDADTADLTDEELAAKAAALHRALSPWLLH